MKNLFGALCLSAALFFSSCGRYTVDFPPPSDNAGLTELFPERIADEPMTATVSGFDQGVSYAYRGIGSIWVYRAGDSEAAALYFEENVTPLLAQMSRFRYWNIGERRQIRAGGSDGEAVAWTNGKWLFLLRSPGKKEMKKLVRSYPWIE